MRRTAHLKGSEQPPQKNGRMRNLLFPTEEKDGCGEKENRFSPGPNKGTYRGHINKDVSRDKMIRR